MFTALVVTRLVFDGFRNFGTGKGHRFMDQPKFNFMSYAKYAFIASWILFNGFVKLFITFSSYNSGFL